MVSKRVGLIKTSIHADSMMEVHKNRSYLAHSLINAYQLPIIELAASPCYLEDLLLFHDEDYVEYLCSSEHTPNEEYGFEQDFFHDCGIMARTIVGGTLTAMDKLIMDEVDVAIHWEGGRHHSHRSKASGFCFANDIVISILSCISSLSRPILYIDIDIHHGDGVQEAFYFSPSVVTLSFHHYSPGFFPSSGGPDEKGNGKGMDRNINIPLPANINSIDFYSIVVKELDKWMEIVDPELIVAVCGTDGLKNDPIGVWNLDVKCFGDILRHILSFDRKTLILGGGGYEPVNVARAWAWMTAIACFFPEKPPIENEIPFHDEWEVYIKNGGCLIE